MTPSNLNQTNEPIQITHSFRLTFFYFNAYCQDVNTRTYNQVKKEFVTKYVFDDYTSLLRFAKKRQDWYVVVSDYMETEKMKEYLFWNSNAKRFEKLDFTINTANEKSNLNEPTYMDAYYYSWMPYYGYNGYYADNINYLRNKPGKSDDELYCLARAYSEYAGNLLSNQYGSGLDKYSFHKYFYKQNSLSPAELKTFLAYHDSSLQTYAKLVARSPNYNTHIVGSASNKMYNEYMYRYLILSMYHNEQNAIAGLPANLYNDFILAYAKNFLDACPKNAILFVEGDNDTYPVLYYQKSKHYREDITVVNISMLGTEVYPNYLSDTKQVPLSFSFNEENEKQFQYTLMQDRSTDSLYLQDYMKHIADKNVLNQQTHDGYGQVPPLNCKEIILDSKYETIHLPVKKILYRNDNLILDILNTQIYKRPVSFTSGLDPSGILAGLIPHCTYNGFVYNFEDFGAKRNIQIDLDKLVTRLSSVDFYHIPAQPLRSDAFIPDTYKAMLNRGIDLCMQANDTTNAKKLIDSYLKNFPFAKFKLTQSDLMFLFQYKEVYGVAKSKAMLTTFEKLIRKDEYMNDAQRIQFVDMLRTASGMLQ